MPQGSNSDRLGRAIADTSHDEAERGRLLGRSILSLGGAAAAGSLLLLLLNLFGTLSAPLLNGVVLFLLVLDGGFTFATLWFLRRRQYNLAAGVFMYSAVAYITIAVYMVGGASSPLALFYFVPIIAGGLFGKGRDSVRLFFVSLFCYGAIVLGQGARLFAPVIELSGSSRQIFMLVVFALIGGLVAYLAMVWARSVAHFASQSGAQADALFQSNQKLLEKNIQQIELGSELSTAAAQLLAASHQQASGATEQASAVSEVSTTIEELGSTARQIAIAAEQVADASRQTLENLSEGQDAVDNSIQAMERIRGRMRDVSARVLNLGERSQQIGEIIDLINDLSDETHLLALNAAIEAAGAGEHGRRFAVVAAEVKSLANRALAAAKEVKGVIAEIQQATNSAVLAAEEGGKEVEQGVELAHSAGEVMNAIVMVAERTAQSSGEISLATAQQQSASEQVVETMREIADVARQTAAGSRQMAESAQMLTAIAERLHGLAYDNAQSDSLAVDIAAIDRRMRAIADNSGMA